MNTVKRFAVVILVVGDDTFAKVIYAAAPCAANSSMRCCGYI